ncbi:regulation of nuclear pre-mRNA domain-containing protein 2-like isoform X1 [Choloepus didactylus]|uniref:regulation of nuclear pre-mRNA domain-containing protein 2-like isoform X1 n=1 Tax=Choloepus didactylus TaxID=27675 RepID=UPI00189CF734|nr:regulation of nuclear pre-mRNA domain-containing protein 2-like isoform X1 [Choloepus didactylus]
MAAGGGGGSSKASSSSASSAGALESSLDRKFQSVTNTMESIQGLSSWCIENKKHHSTIVYHWMKWLRRSAYPHRLNLFYLANDVIQNCKRKNAIIFRESFADVLPEAAALVNKFCIQHFPRCISWNTSVMKWSEKERFFASLDVNMSPKIPLSLLQSCGDRRISVD